MMLTEEDVKRISSLGYRNFYYEKDGFLYLRNVNGKCVFLDENGLCKIYEHRPEGCRFYPFLYDPDRDEIILDEDCPYRDEFTLENEENLKKLVLRILKERERRIKEDKQ
ncbi:zinc/iron-chelating domain-containing protein [Euryarchaeota archaeon ex4484_178]|nr:MAG: zinc/iron-chelating domain-containing protein [Euryarchaeota archaeon ex4484_178]